MSQPPTPARRLTDPEIELMIERASRRSVEDFSRSLLGIDVNDPSSLRAWHADQIWTRSAREGSSKITQAAKTTLIGTLVTGLFAIIWAAFQNGQPPGTP